MKVKLAAGTAMRKKTVIALARRLAIDLWRWRTGRCSMADLGWTQAYPSIRNDTLPLATSRATSVRTFAIGRVLSVTGAGGAQARPFVRWDGLPGRRSHTIMTQWALGFDSTVRIGAGARRNSSRTPESGDTDQPDSRKRTQGRTPPHRRRKEEL